MKTSAVSPMPRASVITIPSTSATQPAALMPLSPSPLQTLAISTGVVAKVYDAQMPSFSADGAWNPKAIEVIRNSLKELGILPEVPAAKDLYNDKFVPVKF